MQEKQNPMVYVALLCLVVVFLWLYIPYSKTKTTPTASQETGAEEGPKMTLYHEDSNAGLSDEDGEKYNLYYRRTKEQFVADANEGGEPRYPDCIYPPMPPEVWVAKGKPMPAEPVFLTEKEQEKRESAKWDKIFDQQAQYNGPVGNRPTP